MMHWPQRSNSPPRTETIGSFVRMQREIVVRMGSKAMMLFAALPIWIDVDHHAAEVGQVMEQLVPDVPRDIVTLCHRQPAWYCHAHVSVQAVTDPTSTHVRHFLNTRDVRGGVDDLV